MREGGFGTQPIGVVAGCGKQLARDVRSDAVQGEELGGRAGREARERLVQFLDLFAEGEDAPAEAAQRGLRGANRFPEVGRP